MAELESLTAGIEQEKVEADTTSATRICELEVAAATGNRELGVAVWAVSSLKSWGTKDASRVETAEVGLVKSPKRCLNLRHM